MEGETIIMSREEQAQLCALLAKLRFDLAKLAVSSSSHIKDYSTEIEMINTLMSICMIP